MPGLFIVVARALGGAGAIVLMEILSRASQAPMATIPFATSIVLVMGSPDAPPARLRCLLGGHVICASSGIVCTMLLGYEPWVAAIAIGTAIVLMHTFDAFHPPAGISPIIIASTHATPLFILSPVLTGALILSAYAALYYRLSGESWPKCSR